MYRGEYAKLQEFTRSGSIQCVAYDQWENGTPPWTPLRELVVVVAVSQKLPSRNRECFRRITSTHTFDREFSSNFNCSRISSEWARVLFFRRLRGRSCRRKLRGRFRLVPYYFSRIPAHLTGHPAGRARERILDPIARLPIETPSSLIATTLTFFSSFFFIIIFLYCSNREYTC